jgi:hypothetical protein
VVANAKNAHARIGRFIQILPVPFEADGAPLDDLDPACLKKFWARCVEISPAQTTPK